MCITDLVFGEMKYHYRWEKQETIPFCGIKKKVTVAAKAYSGEQINDKQRDAYRYFTTHVEQIGKECFELATEYIWKNFDQIALYFPNVKLLETPQELHKVMDLKTLYFSQEGECILLFKTEWAEDDIAIMIYPEKKIGAQNLFL